MEYLKELRDYLERTGKKMTIERIEILNAVVKISQNIDNKDGIKHFNAKDVYCQIKVENSPLSLATVYRSLPILAEAGLITEVAKRGGKMIYELVSDRAHHDHIICNECGLIIEFENKEIERLQEEVCKKYNFEMTDHTLSITGRCAVCRARYN